jgi:peptidoglycan-associated lipoprotein
MFGKLRLILCAGLLAITASCMMPPGQGKDTDRFLIYFDEFSANLTPEAQKTVADAAAAFNTTKARGIRIEGRASATGSEKANQYLAQTRSQVVADALAKDGLSPTQFRQVAIGQTGSGDTSVAERRVDIVLER